MRRTLLLCFLGVAYSIVLGHGLIPHTHHAHHNESKHHHHSDNNHHHTHDENHDEKSSDFDNFLAHFPHSPYTTDIKYTLISDDTINGFENYFYSSFFNEEISSFRVALLDKELPPEITDKLHSSYIVSCSSLRAPPLTF